MDRWTDGEQMGKWKDGWVDGQMDGGHPCCIFSNSLNIRSQKTVPPPLLPTPAPRNLMEKGLGLQGVLGVL